MSCSCASRKRLFSAAAHDRCTRKPRARVNEAARALSARSAPAPATRSTTTLDGMKRSKISTADQVRAGVREAAGANLRA